MELPVIISPEVIAALANQDIPESHAKKTSTNVKLNLVSTGELAITFLEVINVPVNLVIQEKTARQMWMNVSLPSLVSMELPVTILLEVIAALVHQDILAKTAEKISTNAKLQNLANTKASAKIFLEVTNVLANQVIQGKTARQISTNAQ